MLSRLQQSSRVSFSFSVTRNLMMWVRLFGLPLWVIGIVFTVFLVSISLQSFGRLHRMSRAEHRSNKCKRFKTKAGFGEGTPQQVRPECETQFQILKLWPQVDTCLSLFRPKQKYRFQTGFRFPKLGVQVPIEVSPIAGVAACTGSAFLPLCCSGVVRLARILYGVVARYPDPDGLCSFQGAGMKNCRPVVRLQILSEYKENRPARDQRILS